MSYPTPIIASSGGSGAPGVVDTVGTTVVATTLTTLIPALGVGIRVRIVGGQLNISRTSGAAAVDLSLLNGAAGGVLFRALGLSLAGQPGVPILLPEPGLQLDDNTALVLAETATVAVGLWVATIYYYQDAVT